MLGTSLALGFTLAMSMNSIITRRGVLRASAGYVANISIMSGPVFFVAIALVTGEIFKLGQFTPQTYAFFAMSGIIHFVVGRTFGYRSIQLIGSTRSNLATGMSAIVSVTLAVTVLEEMLTPLMTLGILLSMSGPLLVAFKERNFSWTVDPGAGRHAKVVDRHSLYLGMLFGLGSALFWGSSGVFVKLGLESGGTSIAGTLIAYVAATLAISPLITLNRETRGELLNGDGKSLRLALLTGLATNVGQMLRYLALAYAPLITVSIIMRTTPIWILMLAFLFNRKLENFSRWMLLGNSLLLMGTILVVTGP